MDFKCCINLPCVKKLTLIVLGQYILIGGTGIYPFLDNIMAAIKGAAASLGEPISSLFQQRSDNYSDAKDEKLG